MVMDSTGLTVVRQRMRVVGVQVEIEQFKRDPEFLLEMVNGESAELAMMLVPMGDTHTSFMILCLSVVSRLTYLLRTASPSITHKASAGCDALMERALACIKPGSGAAVARLPIPEEVAHDPSVCQPKATTRGPRRPTPPSEKVVSDLLRVGLGTCGHYLRPGEPSIPPRMAAWAPYGASTP